ncbi:Protein CBG27367 [Caenorhabditis briggsae]|uniref:Uncharacterized protein n=2 Tax=Caenorhabditis briggsae TaxID=6238 RepID=A0AAE9A0A0_CAEBR|nr:Protein CBG27367 [Caenorhabditis briggsae]ULT88207.1 hypothetical protein L3Y34_007424 [Caenorhabditis briggsae]CAR98997.1 Protein CBG27367 [Caenorhabditis briggsae]
MDQTALIEMLKQKNEEIKKNIANQSSEHELKIETRKNAIQLIGKAHQQKMSHLLTLFLITKEYLENENTKNNLKNFSEVIYTSKLIIEKIRIVLTNEEDQNEELLEVCHEFPAESLASLKNQVTTFSTDLLNSRYFKEPAHTQLKASSINFNQHD